VVRVVADDVVVVVPVVVAIPVVVVVEVVDGEVPSEITETVLEPSLVTNTSPLAES